MNGHSVCLTAILHVCLLALPQTTWSDDSIQQGQPPKLCGEFSIGRDGRPILLPVEIDGETVLFMLDTGACRCAFDVCLRNALGKPLGNRLLQTPAGRSEVEAFEWAETTINHRRLKTDTFVICIDLAQLRGATNEPVFGVIGMDVLRSCRFQIDFDHGLIRFLDSLPRETAELGTRIPIDFSNEGIPCLVASFANRASANFLVDTGAHGNSLRPVLFDELCQQQMMLMDGSFRSMTVNGEVNGYRGTLNYLFVGPNTHQGLRMARVGSNALGLRFLSRFVVTFDFPGHAMYLRKGNHFSERVEPNASSGMSLRWVDGVITVTSVKEGGPAAKVDVRTNDVIVWVDGKSASDYDHFSLRQLLTSDAGRRVPARILRNGCEIEVAIILESD